MPCTPSGKDGCRSENRVWWVAFSRMLHSKLFPSRQCKDGPVTKITRIKIKVEYRGISKGIKNKIKQPNTQCNLPSSTTALIEVSLRTRGLRARNLLKQRTTFLKCKAHFRSDVVYSVGVRLSAFFADLGCELFHNAQCWWPTTTRTSKNQCCCVRFRGFALRTYFAWCSRDICM